MSEPDPAATAASSGSGRREPIRPLPSTPREPAEKKASSDLLPRMASAVVLISLVSYVVVLGGLWFLAVVMVLILLGQLISVELDPLPYALLAGAIRFFRRVITFPR